ncbi:hypothetical protein SK128_021720, partial [Halocaridina rubra]
ASCSYRVSWQCRLSATLLSICVKILLHRESERQREFDVYTMETALPKIDWDAIEAHLKATKDAERR